MGGSGMRSLPMACGIDATAIGKLRRRRLPLPPLFLTRPMVQTGRERRGEADGRPAGEVTGQLRAGPEPWADGRESLRLQRGHRIVSAPNWGGTLIFRPQAQVRNWKPLTLRMISPI